MARDAIISNNGAGTTYYFHKISGAPDHPSEEIRATTRPGVDGKEFQRLAQKPGAARLRTMVDCNERGLANDASAQMTVFKALEGTLIRVLVDGQQLDGVYVRQVRQVGLPSGRKGMIGKLYDGTYMLTIDWIVENTDLL